MFRLTWLKLRLKAVFQFCELITIKNCACNAAQLNLSFEWPHCHVTNGKIRFVIVNHLDNNTNEESIQIMWKQFLLIIGVTLKP